VADEWTSMPVTEIRPGDQVRLATGDELLVARVEPEFFGRPDMLALIEDTPTRWLKAPMPSSATAEVRRPG